MKAIYHAVSKCLILKNEGMLSQMLVAQ